MDQEERAISDALRRGEGWAFEALHRRHTPLMLAIAMRYVGSRALAEDIVQDTWLGVMQGIARFEGRSTLKTWIFRILHYRARSASAREARSIALSALEAQSHDPLRPGVDQDVLAAQADPARYGSPEDQALTAEVGAQIVAALDTLPRQQRAVVLLRDVAGLPADEVCARLRLSPGNQRVLLHRARQRMRRAISGYAQPS